MWLAAFSRGTKMCNLKPKWPLLSGSPESLESLNTGQKETKVQEQGISFPCPLLDIRE